METCALEPSGRRFLEGLRQFCSKSAAGRLIAIPSATLPAVWPLLGAIDDIGIGGGALRWLRLSLPAWSRGALRRLGRIRAQQAIFERRTIETANNGGHFIGGGRFDKSEALGFLRFVVADHFDGVGHEIFGGQPLFNIVGGDPCGEVAKKNGKAHSVII